MALPATAYLYEFLYRGQPAGSGQPAAWHLIVAVPGTDAFGTATLALSAAMTPGQAAEQGVALPDVLSGINTSVMADLATAQVEIAALKSELAMMRATPVEEVVPAPPA